MKKGTKTALLAVCIGIAVLAAFLLGTMAGKGRDNQPDIPSDSAQSDSSSQSGSTDSDNRMSDNIFNLLTAFDDYMDAAVQQAEVELELKFGSLAFDEEFTVASGIANDMPVSHIQRGRLDIYICDGQVFVEDDNAHFDVNSSEALSGFNMRHIFAIAYEIAQNSDFEVTTAGTETVYTVTLTQQQIENILNSFQSTMNDYNIKIEKGVLRIIFEDGKLDELDITCTGYTEILTAQVEGGISVSADLSVSDQPISLPQSIFEQLN